MSNDTTPHDTDAGYDALQAEAARLDAEAASALLDHATRRLFAWVRGFVRSVLETDYDRCWPGNLLRGETIWQWARFEMLDWLHPIEKLLRRMLLIEAHALLETQALPPARPRREAGRAAHSLATSKAPPAIPAASRPDDPDHPEHWRVSFRILPRQSRTRLRRSVPLPTPRNDDGEVISPRFRCTLWDAAPLARRFEAVIRICSKPQPFIRRLAFRLRAAGRRLHAGILRLCAEKPTDKFARDANSSAAIRLLECWDAFWSSA